MYYKSLYYLELEPTAKAAATSNSTAQAKS